MGKYGMEFFHSEVFGWRPVRQVILQWTFQESIHEIQNFLRIKIKVRYLESICGLSSGESLKMNLYHSQVRWSCSTYYTYC